MFTWFNRLFRRKIEDNSLESQLLDSLINDIETGQVVWTATIANSNTNSVYEYSVVYTYAPVPEISFQIFSVYHGYKLYMNKNIVCRNAKRLWDVLEHARMRREKDALYNKIQSFLVEKTS